MHSNERMKRSERRRSRWNSIIRRKYIYVFLPRENINCTMRQVVGIGRVFSDLTNPWYYIQQVNVTQALLCRQSGQIKKTPRVTIKVPRRARQPNRLSTSATKTL